MKYKRKHLLLALMATLILVTTGISEAKGARGGASYPGILSVDVLQNLQLFIAFPADGIEETHTGFGNLVYLVNGAENSSTNQTGDTTLFQTFLDRYSEASLKVKILVVILFYLLLSIIVLFIAILINRQIKSRQRKQIRELKNEYQEQLASFLFDDDIERVEFRGIDRKRNRQMLIDEIMDLHNNLHGEAADKLKELYFNMELHKDSLKKVYSRKWSLKSKGFGELAQMDVKDANDKIREYINSKNQILRMEAQVAMVKLSEDDPLGFLDELEYELSYWEQVNIYDTLTYHYITIESFERWLDNKNPSVVIFALRMIKLFKHVHSADKVREFIFNDNPDIALAAVQTLKELEIPDYVEDLKILYDSETLKLIDILEKQRRKEKTEKDIKSMDDLIPRKIRYEILLAIQPLAAEGDIPFLEKAILEPENSFKLRILAISILMSIRPQGEIALNKLLDSDNELIKKMIINVKQNQES